MEFTELLVLSDEDNKRIIEVFVMGQPFQKDFIRSLHLEDSKRECLDYNEHLSHLKYYQGRVESFKAYIETMKTWY